MINIQRFGGRGASSSAKEKTISVKSIDISKWETIKGKGYKLSNDIVIEKSPDVTFGNNSNTYMLKVKDKDIMQNGSGYTIKYLKELGSLYQKYGINNKIIYNDTTNEVIIRKK